MSGTGVPDGETVGGLRMAEQPMSSACGGPDDHSMALLHSFP